MRNRRTNMLMGVITALNGQVAIKCEQASGVLLQILATAISATFVVEGSTDSTNGVDGTWMALGLGATNATNMYTQTANTGALTAQPGSGWVARVVPFTWVRVRCSAWTSGTNVQARLTAFAGQI
jgi:hypothetical protein